MSVLHWEKMRLNYRCSVSEENLSQRPVIEEMKQSVDEKVQLKRENQQSAYAKTKAQKLISAFVFATPIVQALFFLNLKFQASIHLLCLYSLVCVGPIRKPDCWFSRFVAQL